MDVGSAFDLAFTNWVFFAAVIAIRLAASHQGVRSFRLSLRPEGLLLYLEGAAAAIGSWFARGLHFVLTGHGSVALQVPGREFWVALGWAALGYLPVALFEESLFRGYLQDHLAARRGVAFAIAAQAVAFGSMHILSWTPFSGEWVKIAMVAVLGLALGTAARNGRSLMWGVGFHQWWNITESLIEGPVSPVRLTAAGGLTGSLFACWVGLASAIVVLGCVRLRFSGRTVPVGQPDIVVHPDGVSLALPGNSMDEAMTGNAVKGAPSLDPDPTAG